MHAAPEFVQPLKETGEPPILTINGKAEPVVRDAALADVRRDLRLPQGS